MFLWSWSSQLWRKIIYRIETCIAWFIFVLLSVFLRACLLPETTWTKQTLKLMTLTAFMIKAVRVFVWRLQWRHPYFTSWRYIFGHITPNLFPRRRVGSGIRLTTPEPGVHIKINGQFQCNFNFQILSLAFEGVCNWHSRCTLALMRRGNNVMNPFDRGNVCSYPTSHYKYTPQIHFNPSLCSSLISLCSNSFLILLLRSITYLHGSAEGLW